MTAVHYCTFGGADNRGHYLRRSYEFCQSWFDSFHISDTGATDVTTQLTAELLGDPRVRYKKIPESYLQQPSWLEAIEQVIADIPDGDWFLFMDSDERPAPTLLRQLRRAVAIADAQDCCQYLITGLLHIDGAPEEVSANALLRQPTTEEEFHNSGIWVKGNLIRKVPELQITAAGAHYGFHVERPGSPRYLPGVWYNHYQTTSDSAMRWLRHAWPIGRMQTCGVPADSPEIQRHNSIVEATDGLWYANDLMAAIREQRLPWFVHDYLSSLLDSPYTCLQQMGEAAVVWNYKSACLDDCVGPCCRYS